MTARAPEPVWPESGGQPIVFLLDASSGLERRILREWIEQHRPPDLAPGSVEVASLPDSRLRRPRIRKVDPRLATILLEEEDYDPLLVPLGIAWLAPLRRGARTIRPSDLLKFGDPRDPDWLRQYWILNRHPDRCRIVMGAPAPVSQLRARWRGRTIPGDPADAGLPSFVAVQAGLALAREERALRGNRYKVPKFVKEDLLASRRVQAGLAQIAIETDWPAARVPKRAVRYLREIAATHSPYVIDLLAHFIRFIIQRSYEGTVHYDRQQLAEVYQEGEGHSLVFLPSHKSYIDGALLRHVLYENDYPPNHTAGGINMNFFPIGPFVRRAGVFFIRRTFRGNPVYKFMLRQYIYYLLEKAFPIEWYIEGGRSRSGKLREPRYGMMGYVVGAYDAGAADDVSFIPVAIAYDQLFDVVDYTAEQSGRGKSSESFGRLLQFLRAMRHAHGAVYLRIGRPMSLLAELGPPDPARDRSERQLEVQKLAFEVMFRINEVMPITPISLVTLALLGSGDRALSVHETQALLRPYLDEVRQRSLPTTEEIELDTPDQVAEALDHLMDHGVVTRFTEGDEMLYGIQSEQHFAAAFYRNTIIHFFIEDAISEIALVAAGESGDPEPAFWDEARRLRDLLKFEFFFRRRPEYRAEIARGLERRHAGWQADVASGKATDVLQELRLITAPFVLRPFLEAYRVVADELESLESAQAFDEKRFLSDAMARGRRYRLQHRVERPESMSLVLFRTALQLAANRDLLEPGSDDGRKSLAAEIRRILGRIDLIAAMTAARRSDV